jgi:sortase (surface protein transpeptidase)
MTDSTIDKERLMGPRMVRYVGLVLLVGVPLAWTLSRPSVEMGTAPSAEPAAAVPVEAPPEISTSVVPDTDASTTGAEEVQSAPSPFTTTAPRGRIDQALWPSAVDVPSIGVAAPVLAVGVGSEGELVIPESVLDVGWYQGSAVPGESGVALLTSHLDTRSQGRGVFSGLTSLEVGAAIELRDGRGSATTWRVIAREQHLKTDLPAQLFARTGPPLLALVTCGGPFDRDARSYRDNVIVWAELVA